MKKPAEFCRAAMDKGYVKTSTEFWLLAKKNGEDAEQTFNRLNQSVPVPSLDTSYSEILPNLYMGGMSAFVQMGSRGLHYDLWIQCAMEFCAEEILDSAIDGGLDDSDADQTALIEPLAQKGYEAIQAGKTILVTCAEGKNRSGVVVGRILQLLGYKNVIEMIRERRHPSCLSNKTFCNYLSSIRTVPSEPILEFQEEYRFLSNFWPAKILFDGKEYPTTEHAFQAAKTLVPEEREAIRVASTPAMAKKLGKTVTLRSDWKTIRVEIMKDLNTQKYEIPELREKLLATGDRELIEGNRWHDYFWGMCNGKGQNNLGKILMEIRSSLQSSPEPIPTKEIPAAQKKIYSGVGSRQTPINVQNQMKAIAQFLEKKGYILRTGDASGADHAFRTAVKKPVVFRAEDCLPWAKEEVKKYISSDRPPLEKMKPYTQKLIARDMQQVLGMEGDDPSSFLICWTKDGLDSGGTAYAMRCAKAHGIPVFNLRSRKDRDELETFLKSL